MAEAQERVITGDTELIQATDAFLNFVSADWDVASLWEAASQHAAKTGMVSDVAAGVSEATKLEVAETLKSAPARLVGVEGKSRSPSLGKPRKLRWGDADTSEPKSPSLARPGTHPKSGAPHEPIAPPMNKTRPNLGPVRSAAGLHTV